MEKIRIIKYFVISIFLLNFACLKAYADIESRQFFDVYKSRQVTADEVYNKFRPEFEALLKENIKLDDENNYRRAVKLKEKILDGVSKMGDFSYINLDLTWYMDNKVYISLDLVDRGDKRLLNFYSKPDDNLPDPEHLIKTWQEYQKIVFTNKIFTQKSCPAFHCISDFEHPLVKKYAKIFNDKVPQEESKLIKILQNDRDDNKRATAAFLLAHIKDGKKLVKLLVPAMRDPSPHVRNNVMRVLAETIRKLKDVDFPVDEAIAALDFPASTDRNKALFIIAALSMQPKYKDYLIRHAHEKLIELLKFNAPNVHQIANGTLHFITGQNYAERDYQAWENWFEKHR